ncbi:MAG: bifunctional riboflavin kinase/FAD synthetase [Armatimonadetes bacterium]|nr:bifunctional riboflavin kinase/FAD synthetase [Armatimonadota bacterium]
MNVVRGLEDLPSDTGPAAVALGTFDGLHLGHRAVVAALRSAAARGGLRSVATTFDPHPLTVVAPPDQPFLLTTIEERTDLFAPLGIDTLLIVRFDAGLREVSAAGWLEMLSGRLRAREMVVSSNHAFGRGREGNIAMLQGWAGARGIGVTVVPAVHNGGAVISSSGIRERLRVGDVRTAAQWLGRWYTVRGEVVAGDGRGRVLGVPTANLQISPQKVVPCPGVYAAYATVTGQIHMAAVNIGVRPTFGAGPQTMEAHLLDADQDLYGQTVDVAFVSRLRDERRFPDRETLEVRMAEDLIAVRACLESTGSGADG